MGKPLSRPDCLRQSPRCLGKGDEDEAYIEDCYVPQRSIYDTMRINEQIDQGTKLCQPSRSTLGSGGEVRGEGSTLSSNGTIGAELGGVFVPRSAEHPGGVKRLDERVIFDALKLTGDPQIMSPPVGIVGPGLPIAPSSSGSGGVAAVAKRRHPGGDKRDNPNRRSWKAFMPPSFPEFAERLELEGAEKRLSSGAGLPLSPLQPLPSHLPPSTPTSSTPSLPPYTPSPLSSAPHTPPVTSSPPPLTPTLSPVPPLLQHPLSRQRQLHKQQHRQTPLLLPPTSPKEQSPAFGQTCAPQGSGTTAEHSPLSSRQAAGRREGHRRTPSSSKAAIRQIPEEPVDPVKTSDSERDSPLLDQDQGDNAPLIPPKPVFCPPTKARTWPRSITAGKRAQVGLRHNFPVLPPMPPLLGEDCNTDEESLYLLDPPSPFLQEEEGLVYGGLPLSPCISQEGGDEGLLGWGAQGTELRERTASELKFEEDERRILEELEEQEHEVCRKMIEEEEDEEAALRTEQDRAEEERAQREEREWEAVLKLENREIMNQSWDRETLEAEGWGLAASSGNWPVLSPPSGFEGPGGHSASPCPSSGAESDDLFLELERQCEEDEGEEGEEMSVDPEPCDPYSLPGLEEEDVERQEEATTAWAEFGGTLPLVAVNSDVIKKDSDSTEHTGQSTSFALVRAQDCEKEHGFIDEDYDVDYDENKVEEEERSCPTDSALGQQLESDSQPDRTGITDVSQTDCEQGTNTRTETDLDSGASSEHDDDEDCEQRASFPSLSPLNPYAEEEEEEQVEEEAGQDDRELRDEEEELGTEWDVYDQSEPSLDSSEGVLTDPLHTAETEAECPPDVDVQTPPERTDASEMSLVPMDLVSGLDMTGHDDPGLETSMEVLASTPKSDCVSVLEPPQTHSGPSSSGLDIKDSEAFVISDSFVYLAVSAPPQYPHDCPPSPLDDSVPPSPVLKPPGCPHPDRGEVEGEEEEEGGAFLSPDSFVYMAAPERPQPGLSDACSACEDLDSYSEGTQSGVDFVLGSMTGDSDWESEESALDFPPVGGAEQVWDQLEPGLLQSLFMQAENVTCRTPDDGTRDTVSQVEDQWTTLPRTNTEEGEEVCTQSIQSIRSILIEVEQAEPDAGS